LTRFPDSLVSLQLDPFTDLITTQNKVTLCFRISHEEGLEVSDKCHVCGLSGKYPAIINISRSVCVALMWLGSQSEETLLRICEQSLSRGASQSAVRWRWLSLCAVHLQWTSEQISFITTMHLPILHLLCRIFWQSISSPRSVSPPTLQIWLPATSGFSRS
jgi:hypothetical protein